MKVSELIEKLKESMGEHGDIEVAYQCKHWWLKTPERVEEGENEGTPVIQII